MMEREQAIEATGEDVDSAIATGLARLGIQRDEVEIEVLDQGSRGVFGLGARAAHVRLMPKSKPQAPPVSETRPEPAAPLTAPPSEQVAETASEEQIGQAESDEERTGEVARGVLLELLALMGMDKTQVDVRHAEPSDDEREAPMVLDVHGPSTELLIGRRGTTLAALQHITRLIVGRELAGRAWLVLDVDGFKARREKSLRHLAQRMADQAIRTQRTAVLEPMPPHERRIIHLALRDRPDVTTQSIGEGDRRKVTIVPR
jgi:spoIIIJ-associated protein